jgi:hypothetical protein
MVLDPVDLSAELKPAARLNAPPEGDTLMAGSVSWTTPRANRGGAPGRPRGPDPDVLSTRTVMGDVGSESLRTTVCILT